MGTDGPIHLGDGLWWVGTRMPNDSFQCHSYFLENGDASVLIDPGSPLTIAGTLDKVASISSIDSIEYLVCHHPDPDIAAALPHLSQALTRDDVVVVTEWRAEALLRHYGHRFGYYRVEDNDWRIPLHDTRSLEFQLTPYLHFPGAMVSYDTGTGTLFSSDLFGGFVPDSDVLVSHDLAYIIDNARPFHQHYMPSTELLYAGLTRVEHRWPRITQIAPQHGHVIPEEIVDDAFAALKGIECGVFTLADADVDLKHLLRISEARAGLTEALLTIAEPASLVAAMNGILAGTHEAHGCLLFIDMPDEGWTMWGMGLDHGVRRAPDPNWPAIQLPGTPTALLSIHTSDELRPNGDLVGMLEDMANTVRPAIDQYLAQHRVERRSNALRTAAMTDPLTGLGNRRALGSRVPRGDYALISLDLDHFKIVNDTFGHAAGDRVLVRVGDTLATIVRDTDSVYRMGGEEFLVCMPDADEAAATGLAERIREAVRGLDLAGVTPDGHVTVSAGIATAADAGRMDFEAHLAAADEALYRSKAAGRDRITMQANA